MNSIGMYGLLSAITTTTPTLSQSSSDTSISSSRQFIRRYVFGLHAKTKRSLAEEAENGDEISVVSWIKDGTDPNEIDAYGYSPLLNAAAIGRLCALEKLIINGADVNKTGPFGFTPLHAAAQVSFFVFIFR
jgi:ankyrin repeat protein